MPEERQESLSAGALGGLSTASPSLLLAFLYFAAFVVLLPLIWSHLQYRGGSLFLQLTVAFLAVLLVHAVLNWAYVAVVAAPVTLAIAFVVVGTVAWITTPLLMLLFTFLSHIATDFLGLGVGSSLGFNFNAELTFIGEFFTRVSQTIIALGGAFWWLAQKAARINQVALTAYLIALGLFGTITGAFSFPALVLFLVLLLVIQMKLKQEPGAKDVTKIFRWVATAALLLGILPMEGGIAFHSGFQTFTSLYKLTLLILMLTGVWKPASLLKLLPSEWQEVLFEGVKGLLPLVRVPQTTEEA